MIFPIELECGHVLCHSCLMSRHVMKGTCSKCMKPINGYTALNQSTTKLEYLTNHVKYPLFLIEQENSYVLFSQYNNNIILHNILEASINKQSGNNIEHPIFSLNINGSIAKFDINKMELNFVESTDKMKIRVLLSSDNISNYNIISLEFALFTK